MLRKAGVAVCMLAVLGLAGASLAGAEETGPNRVGGKFGVFGNFGFSSYAMGDVNSMIDGQKADMDALQTMQNGFSGSGPSDINGGLTFGGGVQYGIMDNLAIGVEVGSLATSPVKWSYSYQALTGYDTTNPFNPTPIYSNASFSYETDFSAMEIGPVIRGYLPIGERLLLNGTLGLEYVALSGTTKYTSSLSPDQNTSFSGSTLGVKVTVGAEFFFSSLISVGVDLGYRMADITNVKDSDGNAWTKADGSSMSVDYSGLIMQGGIRLYF